MSKEVVKLKPVCFKCSTTVKFKMKSHTIKFAKGEFSGKEFTLFTCPQHGYFKPSEVERELEKGNVHILDLGISNLKEENISLDYR